MAEDPKPAKKPRKKRGMSSKAQQDRRVRLIEQALELRLQGHTLRHIGAALDCTPSAASSYIKAGLEEVAEHSRDTAHLLRDTESARIEMVIRNMATQLDDPQCASVFLKAIEAKRKLWGLDAPTQIAILDLSPEVVAGLDSDQVDRLMAGEDPGTVVPGLRAQIN